MSKTKKTQRDKPFIDPNDAGYKAVEQRRMNAKKYLIQSLQEFAKAMEGSSDEFKKKNYEKFADYFTRGTGDFLAMVNTPVTQKSLKSIQFIRDILSVDPKDRATAVQTTNVANAVKNYAQTMLQKFQTAVKGTNIVTGAMRASLLDIQDKLRNIPQPPAKPLAARSKTLTDLYTFAQDMKNVPKYSITPQGYKYLDSRLIHLQPFKEDKLQEIGRDVYNRLQIPMTNHLEVFPQWLMRRNQSHGKQQLPDAGKLALYLKDKENAQMKNLANIDSTMAYWDQSDGVWKGRAVDKLYSKSTKVQNFSKRYAANSYVFETKVDQTELNQQVPLIVKDIVAANTKLSTAGFGPVSPNSLALYAGRWMDTTTGSVRVLPTASTKYLNPMSPQQRLGYLQARILNHWNNLVATAQEYNKLNQPKALDKYKKTAQLAIERTFKPSAYKDLTNKFIDRVIDEYVITMTLGNAIPNALTPINRARKLILDGIGMDRLKEIRLLNDKTQVQEWRKAVQTSYERAMVVLSKRNTSQDTLKVMAEMTNAYLSLTNTFTNKLKNNIRRLIKSRVIPESMTEDNLLVSLENVDQANQQLTRFMDDIVISPANTKAFIDQIRTTMIGASPQDLRNALKIPQESTSLIGSTLQKWNDVTPLALAPSIKGIQYVERRPVLPPRAGKDKIYRKLFNMSNNMDPVGNKSYQNNTVDDQLDIYDQS